MKYALPFLMNCIPPFTLKGSICLLPSIRSVRLQFLITIDLLLYFKIASTSPSIYKKCTPPVLTEKL